MDAEKRDRGLLRVDVDECKGCGLCVEACPPKVIGLSERLNHYGYRTATYAGAGCTGCGICFHGVSRAGGDYGSASSESAGRLGRRVDAGIAGASECASN